MRFHRFTPSGCSTCPDDDTNSTLLNRHVWLVRALFGYRMIRASVLTEGIIPALCDEVERLGDEVAKLKRERGDCA